jgi:hypothetical protein
MYLLDAGAPLGVDVEGAGEHVAEGHLPVDHLRHHSRRIGGISDLRAHPAPPFGEPCPIRGIVLDDLDEKQALAWVKIEPATRLRNPRLPQRIIDAYRAGLA